MPAKYAILDEVDAYEADVEGEGSPVDLVRQRLKTFGRFGKMFMISTPTIKGRSQIEHAYEATDQRRYFVPCPHCEHMQWLKFENLKWDKGRPETARYYCVECGCEIEERHKEWMLPRGEWRPTAACEDKRAIGFHLSALYSPVGWESWENIARNWEAAQGNESKLKTFINTTLGETWHERGEAPEWQRLYDRREKWVLGSVPRQALFLTAGVDLQRDRIEVHVWGWSRGMRSWLVDVIVHYGTVSNINDPCWAELRKTLDKQWLHPSGKQLPILKAAVDTGDGLTTSVAYDWCAKQGGQQVVAIKGDKERIKAGSPVTGPTYVDVGPTGRKRKRGLKLWHVSGAFFKAETYRFLRLDKPTDEALELGERYPDGYVHLPDGINSDWVKQLVAEQLVVKKSPRGFPYSVWESLPGQERNEALDCRVYARGMVYLMGADRWPDSTWSRLEIEVDALADVPAPPVVEQPASDNVPVPPVPAPRKPRKAASRWL
jgi:phage terminase large subunit GpA-like protein